jgi:hypothetical protein
MHGRSRGLDRGPCPSYRFAKCKDHRHARLICLCDMPLRHLKPGPLRQQMSAVHDGLQEIANANNDPILAVTIAQTIGLFAALAAMVNGTDGAQPPALPINAAVFQGLLTLAGPETAPELLTQVIADLTAAHVAITTAVTPPGNPTAWPVLRAQSHILVAVAGAIGAAPLLAEAEAMNALASQPAAEVPLPQLSRLLNAIMRLVEYLQTHYANDLVP